jgi:hypothetical protein
VASRADLLWTHLQQKFGLEGNHSLIVQYQQKLYLILIAPRTSPIPALTLMLDIQLKVNVSGTILLDLNIGSVEQAILRKSPTLLLPTSLQRSNSNGLAKPLASRTVTSTMPIHSHNTSSTSTNFTAPSSCKAHGCGVQTMIWKVA